MMKIMFLAWLFLLACLSAYGQQAENAKPGEQKDPRSISMEQKSGEILVGGKYLNFPVQNGAANRLVTLSVGGKTVREFVIELANDKADFRVFADVSPWKSQRMSLCLDDVPASDEILERISQSDSLDDSTDLYKEALRPQYHFTSKRGWLNDPNGLLYYEDEYHLFYQHNPYGCKHGNMHWGHAVSADLLHWEELDEALYPDELGTCWSGSGVVDEHNTTGWQVGDAQPLVLIYTAAGGQSRESQGRPLTQCLAYSADMGRTWTKYAKNPVLGHIVGMNRDPKVIWHDATSKWVMALYLDGSQYALFTSPDLKQWTKTDEIDLPGCSECPDFFTLPLDGDRKKTKWVFWSATGGYLVGSFDGRKFTKETDLLRLHPVHASLAYAAQTWSGLPAKGGRCIRTCWVYTDFPDMPFNCCMTVPHEITLRSTDEGMRLGVLPIRELSSLVTEEHAAHNLTINDETHNFTGVSSELLDIQVDWAIGKAKELEVSCHGLPIVYNAERNLLVCQGVSIEMTPVYRRINLRILVDRGVVEIFGKDGLVYLPCGYIPKDKEKTISFTARGGQSKIVSMKVLELKSAWEQ